MLLKYPKTRSWTKDEYYKAADLGWFDRQRVELIDGEVVEMPPQKDLHAAALAMTDYALRDVFGKGYVVRGQSPVNFGEKSQPEPDLVVVRGSPKTVLKHPTTALLFVEISDTTLVYDRSRKARLYASRGILDYWIVNLVDRQIEVHRKPVADHTDPFGHQYTELTFYAPAESISPLAAKRAKVKVADLLP